MHPNLIEITLKDKGNVDSHVTTPEHIKAQTVPIIPEMLFTMDHLRPEKSADILHTNF